jgi:hypothetical protein
MNRVNNYKHLIMLAVIIAASGCSTHDMPTSERKLFGISVRRNEPQPVYKRTRLAYLPAPLPVARSLRTSPPLILPVMHFELADASLEEAAKLLGDTSRYSSYCASTIADKRISLTALGTIDELAQAIAKIAKIETVVDHHNREIRFLAGETIEEGAVKPELL